MPSERAPPIAPSSPRYVALASFNLLFSVHFTQQPPISRCSRRAVSSSSYVLRASCLPITAAICAPRSLAKLIELNRSSVRWYAALADATCFSSSSLWVSSEARRPQLSFLFGQPISLPCFIPLRFSCQPGLG